MIYIATEIDLSEAESSFTESEIANIVKTMKSVDISQKYPDGTLAGKCRTIMENFSVELPEIWYASYGKTNILTMRKPQGNILVLPVFLKLDQYREYYKRFANVGNDFDSTAFAFVSYPFILKSGQYNPKSEKLKLGFSIQNYSQGTMTAIYDIPEGVLNSYISRISRELGISKIGLVFPSLSNYNFKDTNAGFEIREYHQLPEGTIVYAN